MGKDRLTATDVGALWRVSRQAVGKWVDSGCPRGRDGLFDLTAVIRWREQQILARADRQAGGSPELERWRQIRADREQIRLDSDRGALIETSTAASWWADRIVEARVALQGMGTALAPACVGQDAATIQRLINDRLERVCSDLARQAEDSLCDEPAESPAERHVNDDSDTGD